MARLHSTIVLAGLSSLTLIAGFSQAPAKAQANALQQLSREMIGSSFEEDTSTTLPGNPSLVDDGRGNLNRVMTDLVDEEIRRRPVPVAQPVGPQRGPKTVQLIVPVKTGLEYARIQALLPGVKILEMIGRVYVLVSESPRALQAYELGRKLQARLGVGFELAYSDGHPDLNLAWMGAVFADLAAAPKPVDPTVADRVARQPAPAPEPGSAKDLQGLELRSPWLAAAVKAPPASEPVAPNPAAALQAAEPIRTATPEQRAVEPVKTASAEAATEPSPAPAAMTTAAVAVMKSATSEPVAPKPAVTVQAAEPLRTVAPEQRAVEPVKTASAEAAAEQSSAPAALATAPPPSLRDTLAELRAMRLSTVVASTPAPAPAQVAPKVAEDRQHQRPASLVQAVAIRPASVGDVPLVSTRFMAVNNNLAYVYVKVRNTTELAALKQVSPVAEAHDRNGELLARVGVYNNSRVSQRLQQRQLQQLKQGGYTVEVIAGKAFGVNANQA